MNNPFHFSERFVLTSDEDGQHPIEPPQALRIFLNEKEVFGHWRSSSANWQATPSDPLATTHSKDKLMDLRKTVNMLADFTTKPSVRTDLRGGPTRRVVRDDPRQKYKELFLSGSVSKGNNRLTFGPNPQGKRVPKFLIAEGKPADYYFYPVQLRLGPTPTSSQWLKGTHDQYNQFFWGPVPPRSHVVASFILWRPADPADGALARRNLAARILRQHPPAEGWTINGGPVLLPDGTLNENKLTASKPGRNTVEI